MIVVIILYSKRMVIDMIIGELLKDFDQYNTGCDTVKIVTNDADFGCLVDVELVSIDNLLTEAEFTGLRIKNIKRWWIEIIQVDDYIANLVRLQTCFVIQICTCCRTYTLCCTAEQTAYDHRL